MNHVAVKSLMLENGIAMLIETNPDVVFSELKDCVDSDVSITLTEYGFDLYVNEVIFPIQANMIDHFAKNPLLVVYAGTCEDYLLTPVYNIKIPPELVLEARGAMNYRRTLTDVSA